MVFIYESTATTFADNGLGSLWPSVCDVTEIVNGRFDLSMTHPQDDEGKWQKLIKNRIVKVPYNGSDQLFRIYDVQTNAISKIITVTARHIFYDLLWNLIEDTRPTAMNGNEAGDAILAGCQYTSGFAFSSDITALSTAYYIRQNPVQALIGDIDQSFINRWGGEIVRNNHAIAINSRIGADNGVRIAYAKNLTGLLVTESTDDTYTRIMPLATDADNSVLQLTSKYVDSALIASYPAPIITTVKFDDIKVDPAGTYTTQAAARAEMTTRVAAMYAAGVDLPTITLDVQFVSWADLEEYKAFAALFTVALGDDVTVEYSPLGIDINLRVTEVVYDCLNARYKSLRIGDLVPSLGSHMTGVDSSIAKLGADMANKFDIGTKYNAVSITNEDGFVCESTIGGKAIVTTVNATDGITVTADGVPVFGVNTDGRLFAQSISNLTDSAYYMTYGYLGSPGLECFMPLIGKFLGISPDALGGIQLRDKNVKLRLVITEDGTFEVRDHNETVRLALWSDGSMQIYDASFRPILTSSATATEIRFGGSPDVRGGWDATGFYKYVGGTKTYL